MPGVSIGYCVRTHLTNRGHFEQESARSVSSTDLCLRPGPGSKRERNRAVGEPGDRLAGKKHDAAMLNQDVGFCTAPRCDENRPTGGIPFNVLCLLRE